MADLLNGGIAKLVGTALVNAGMTKPATLTKVTPGVRQPGAIAAGTNPTERTFAARGLVADMRSFQASGTLLKDISRVVRLFGSTIADGAVPEPGDRISIEGTTSTIAGEGGAVSRDPAGASYVCQCR